MLALVTFGKWLESWRERRGFKTRRFLSQHTGVSETLLYELESDRGKPFHDRTDTTRRAIAQVVGFPVDVLDRFSRGEEELPNLLLPVPTREVVGARRVVITIPPDLYDVVAADAEQSGISLDDAAERWVCETVEMIKAMGGFKKTPPPTGDAPLRKPEEPSPPKRPRRK